MFLLPAGVAGLFCHHVEDLEPIVPLRAWASSPAPEPVVCFNRLELNLILDVYGRRVAQGDWRDYALDFGRDRAVFSIFRRAAEVPLYRVVKDPALARKQGQYSVVAQGGLILKRGQDLALVLRVLNKAPKLVG